MKNRRNYYRILHVQPDAPREIIKASYRTLMQKLKLHPDLGGDEWDASILNEAYATLSNETKRAAYDQQILLRVKKTDVPNNPAHGTQNATNDGPQRSPPEYWKNPSACPFCGLSKPARSDYDRGMFDCSRCRSPLENAPIYETRGRSKRKLKRILHDAALQMYTSPGSTTALAGVIRNLSPQGLQFVTVSEMKPGQVIRIVSDVLSACARVCYSSQKNGAAQHLVGVKFITLHFHDQLGTFFSGSA